MTEMRNDLERPEVFNAVKDSIRDARESVRKLAELFTDTVRHMRVEESESVFQSLGRNISDLECFMAFMGELRGALAYYKGFGMAIDPLSSQGEGLKLFQDMHSSLESRDLVLLSDLIEYELCPALAQEDAWLGDLDDRMQEHSGTGTAQAT